MTLHSCYGEFVTQITKSPGLYFDKLLDVKFVNDNWNVITYLDISHVKPNLDKVEFLFHKVDVLCNSLVSSKVQNDCSNSLSALRNQYLKNVNKFSSISYLTDNESTRRVKRGLLDFGGSLLKVFFGTLDAEDATKINEAIDKVQSDEKHLTHLMKDNLHVIKSTISNFNNSMSKVNENEQNLLKNLEVIYDALGKISNSNNKLELKSQLNSLFNSLDSIVLTLSFDIDDINNAILFSKLNILHPTVLNPYQLYTELDKHRNDLPKSHELAVPLTLQNIHEILDISKLTCFYSSNRIVIIVKIPLVLPQTYNLYNIIPIPVPYDITKPNTFALIAPTSPYVAITGDHMFYSLITNIEKCKMISGKCYVCALSNVFSTIANPICETILISEVINKLPNSCETKLLHGQIDIFHRISNNRWLFAQSEPGKCHITCKDNPNSFDEVLFSIGILYIPKNCKAFYKTLQFYPVNEVYVSNVTNRISDFNIVDDDCCEMSRLNKTFSKLPFTKLKNVDNLDSLLHASVHLDYLEKELENMESPSHFQQYSMHYISITYVFGILLLLYMLYKCRRQWRCNNPSGCLIQIYNQCHNRKVSKNPTTQTAVVMSHNHESSSSETEEPQTRTPVPMKRNVILTKHQ